MRWEGFSHFNIYSPIRANWRIDAEVVDSFLVGVYYRKTMQSSKQNLLGLALANHMGGAFARVCFSR